MDILSFISGRGLFLILGIALIIVYYINRRKRR
ncbi:putative secreted protein with PEP-CTERM sorting signal [Mariniflexile fucanivorans]|uniref:Putative secreted protein with PEP-CTERM sorting signal n=1 Tax=Mariniflexile fucanivorans TaxID=264023 RepID=A0A4V6NGW0_9FLAO|nr:putative secreted protein with PEP-CTERM sorting signal [Mariniflexile fucanivorans]